MICICIFFLLMRCNTSQPPMNGTWYRPGHSTLCEEPHAAGGVSCKGEMDRWYSHGMGTRRYTNQIMDVHWLQPATEEVFVFFLRTCVTGSWSISTSVSIFQPKHLQSTYERHMAVERFKWLIFDDRKFLLWFRYELFVYLWFVCLALQLWFWYGFSYGFYMFSIWVLMWVRNCDFSFWFSYTVCFEHTSGTYQNHIKTISKVHNPKFNAYQNHISKSSQNQI